MLFNPRDVQQLANRDFELTDEMCTRLQELKDEIHGPGGDPLTRWTIQYLYEVPFMRLRSTIDTDN